MKVPVLAGTAAARAFRSQTSIWVGLDKSHFAMREPAIQLPCFLFSHEDRTT